MLRNPFDLEDSDRRHKPHEEKEEGKKQTKTTYERRGIPKGRCEVVPTSWQKLPRERRDNNDKSLKPHADVYKDATDDNDVWVGSGLFKPEDLRNDDVACDH